MRPRGSEGLCLVVSERPTWPAVESASKAEADTGWIPSEQCCAPGFICFPGHIINSTNRVCVPTPGLLLQTWLGLWLPWVGTDVQRGIDLSVTLAQCWLLAWQS